MGLNGIPLKTEWWHIVVILGITLFVLARLRRSKTGRAFEAIKEDEIAARLMGVNVAGYKLLAFVLGAVIAGVAGGLNAHYTFTIGQEIMRLKMPSKFSPWLSSVAPAI
jgi:branched-chain amino acid transport system permease protein